MQKSYDKALECFKDFLHFKVSDFMRESKLFENLSLYVLNSIGNILYIMGKYSEVMKWYSQKLLVLKCKLKNDEK